MKISVLAFILIILSGCCSKKDHRLFYVIPEYKPIKNAYLNFYGFHNIILYNDTTIYYHYLPYRGVHMCGTGLDPTKPSFLDLDTEKLVELHFQDLPVLWRRWLKNRREMKFIIISSPTDTIRNPALLKLKQLSEYSKKVMIGINNCTEEQLYVSTAKFQNRTYDPKKVEWKVGFDDGDVPPTLRTLEFIPPIEN